MPGPADAGNNDVKALTRGRINYRAGRCSHDHAGYAANAHYRTDKSALPSMRQEEDAEKGADTSLHVGHKKI